MVKNRTRLPILGPMRLRLVVPMLAACAATAITGCGGGEKAIDQQVKAATFTFDPTVAADDQKWILEAVDQVRPRPAS